MKCPNQRTAPVPDDESAILNSRRRKGVHKTSLERLNLQLQDMPKPTYQPTDDDLPLSLWPEPNFDSSQTELEKK